jgi:hypothetical protein
MSSEPFSSAVQAFELNERIRAKRMIQRREIVEQHRFFMVFSSFGFPSLPLEGFDFIGIK